MSMPSREPLVAVAGLQRLAAREPALERMPVRDLGLARVPAQEDQAVAGERVEVHEPLLDVLEQAAAPVHGLDAELELGAELVAPRDEALEIGDVRVLRRRTRD